MTRHYETFLGSFWVASKKNERVGENNKKDGQKVVQLYFQYITERKTSIQKQFSVSDEESHGARKRRDLGLDVLTSLSLGQYIKASVWDFPVMTSLSVNKWYV